MAFYFRAAISSRSLHGLLLVGPERNFADRFLLGRLAWPDANVRLLPHLRCENGTFDALTRRLDFAMCVIWFATAVALSPYRLSDTLDTYYMCGGPFIPPSVVQLGQNAILGAAIFVSVLFAAHFVRTWIAGHRPNPVKLGLLVTSITFWWYCNNLVSNILVGIALFEVFHDVQYLSLVWIYNRNRVEKDSNIGVFMLFVFRRSGSLIGLYVGLVFAYGSVSYINAHLGMETVKRILTGVVTASTLLH